MACPRIVGLDVSPVTARSRTYRASAPVRSITRLMLSSHRLWPNACSRCAGFGSVSMPTSPIGRRIHLRHVGQHVQTVEGLAAGPHHHRWSFLPGNARRVEPDQLYRSSDIPTYSAIGDPGAGTLRPAAWVAFFWGDRHGPPVASGPFLI